MEKKIKIVSGKKLKKKLLEWQLRRGNTPYARYLALVKGMYLAADNSAGDFYIEEFDDLRKAIVWFDGEAGVQ